jgi:hypothetical protein
MRWHLILLALTASLMVSSCANQMYSFSYSGINQKYARQLDHVELGMSKAEVRKLLPDLHARGQTSVEGEVIEAWELQHNHWDGVGGPLVEERLWFYFHNDQLVKWGQPQDWPQKPDLIVEKRFK